MKIFNKIAVVALAASTLFVSCNKTYPIYEPGEPDVEGCYGVYFPTQEATGDNSFDPTMEKELTFTVARRNSSGAIEVPFKFISDNADLFSYDKIVFEDGQTETSFTVKFPNVESSVEYNFTIAVDDPKYASNYLEGASAVDCSIICVEWLKFFGPNATEATAKGDFTRNTFAAVGADETQTQVEMYYYNTSTPNINFCKLVGALDLGDEPLDYTFYWNTKTNNLYVPDQWTGYTRSSDNLDINIGDVAAFYDSYYGWGATPTQDPDYFTWQPQWIAKNGFLQPYYDGNGGFYLADSIYLSSGGKATGSGWAFGSSSYDDFDLFIAPGFVRVDYTFVMKTDYTADGVSPLYFESGADIANIKYVAVEGKLASSKVKELVAGLTDGTVEGAKELVPEDGEAAVGLTFEKTGLYTAVAVAFDNEGNAQANASVVLDYVAEGDDSRDVTIQVGAEDIHKRYAPAGYDKTNSFGFYVYGSDLTIVRLGVYKTSDVSKNGMQAITEHLLLDSKSVLSEDELNKVNGVGGYTDVFTKLAQNTSYTLVVWATNGTKAKVVTSEYQTAKIPEKFKLLGTGSYTEDLIASIFIDIDVTTYNVEIMESEETPGRYKVVDPYGPAFPYYNDEIYTPGENDLVIDATNPDRVYFAQTDTGINLGYGIMSYMSLAYYYLQKGNTPDAIADAGFYGTLRDGVITFPARGILIQDDDGLYIANVNGEFKVVLPSASGVVANVTETVKAVNISNVKAPKEVVGKREIKSGVRAGISYERETVVASFEATPIAPKANEKRTLGTIECKANLAY